MLQFTYDWGNANKNHNELSTYTLKMPFYKENLKTSVGKGAAKIELLLLECKLVQPLWKW